MLVKFLKPRNWGGVDFKAGKEGDLPDELAAQWIALGIVEAIPEPEPEPAKKAR